MVGRAASVTHFAVPEALAGARLDVAVAQQLGMSRSRAAGAIAAGRVRVNGVAVRKAQLVSVNDDVVVAAAPPPVAQGAPPLPPIRYADEHLLVVSKPAGLVVHPGAGHVSDTLVDALRAAGYALPAGDDPSRPGIVHRLDRDTSGLLLIACSEQARQGLIAALAAREVSRRYVALVRGVPQPPKGRIEGPIGRDPHDRTRFAVVASGRDAITHYAVEASGSVQDGGLPHDVALVSCQLETGRTHQIRVHLAVAGHGVLGDPLYGSGRAIGVSIGLSRQALHAVELRVVHPVTGDEVHVIDPIAPDIIAAARACGIPLDERATRGARD